MIDLKRLYNGFIIMEGSKQLNSILGSKISGYSGLDSSFIKMKPLLSRIIKTVLT